MASPDKSFRAVVIFGFGGIGKTTIATAVYAKSNLNGYNHTRVVMNIDPQKNDIKEKQEQILEDVFPNYNSGRKINLRDQEEGKEHLKRAFQEANKPVFLFIDNALRAEDLRELLPEDLRSLGKHIRLLLTTRDLGATDMFKESPRHEYLVKPLPNNHAMEILCNEKENLDHIKDNVETILKICSGVPLVLKIVGAHLNNQGYRVDKCSQIINALEQGEVVKKENLSERMVDFIFKMFEDSTQEAFLDICSFFCGKNRRHVEYTVGSLELKALEDAALIGFKLAMPSLYFEAAVGKVEKLDVHDVILAKGRNMARSTRIMDIQSFEAAVKEERLEKIKVIALSLDEHHSSYVLNEEQLNSMSKSLRVLALGRNISVSVKSDMTFPELRFLHLDGDIPLVPFHLEGLQKLGVYEGPLLKKGVSIYKLPQSLRAIRATYALIWEGRNWEQSKPMQVTPNSSLEELNLIPFEKLTTLPEGLKSFTALKILNLYMCIGMEELPEVLCGLHWLTTLTLGFCQMKCLPTSFGKLTNLTHLALNACGALEELPTSFGELKALRYLNLERCFSLMKLPSTFGQLTSLQHLNLSRCSSLEELSGFELLIGLKYLNVKYCPNLSRNFGNSREDLQIEDEENDRGNS